MSDIIERAEAEIEDWCGRPYIGDLISDLVAELKAARAENEPTIEAR
jgi:hypothetical protein